MIPGEDTEERKADLRRLVAAHYDRDFLLRSLVDSYQAAVHDRRNELIHLYEIRDALETRFGGQARARRDLRIDAADWKKLGELCNYPSIQQGRHRGLSNLPHRAATIEELMLCRNIALRMIESYGRVLGRV